MKSHVLRPLGVAIGLVVLLLVARLLLVPDDFGVHGENFTYGFYRLGNVQEWKDFPVKYQGTASCIECHQENSALVAQSRHNTIQCENCHGPGADHPASVPALAIDRTREQCLRCHADLDYPHSSRSLIPNITDRRHRRGRECSKCHNPHDPGEDSE